MFCFRERQSDMKEDPELLLSGTWYRNWSQNPKLSRREKNDRGIEFQRKSKKEKEEIESEKEEKAGSIYTLLMNSLDEKNKDCEYSVNVAENLGDEAKNTNKWLHHRQRALKGQFRSLCYKEILLTKSIVKGMTWHTHTHTHSTHIHTNTLTHAHTYLYMCDGVHI